MAPLPGQQARLLLQFARFGAAVAPVCVSPNLKTSTSLIAVLALAGALGVAWWVQRPPATATTKSAAAAQSGVAGGAPARAAVVVETASVRRQAVADDVEAVGSLRSRQGTVVRAEVAGRVVQIGFRDGQKVARGQLLVQLDDRLQQAQLQQAQAELSIAQANHRRNTELVAQGFISQRGLDESAAAVKVAQAKAELARATAARLRVLAPFDGVAGLRNISVGDYLKDGADIVNLEDMNAMYVDFRLPERWQARVRPGQTARVQVEALPERVFAAVVQAVDPQIDANGRSLIVRGCIDNRRLQLRSGMFARVAARLGDDRAALMIPEQAVVSQGGRQSVYRLVKAEGPEGTPAWRGERVDVQTGLRLAGLVEIVQGLAEGERVVTAGQQRIQGDGALLRVADTPAVAAPAAPAASSAAAAVAWAETAPGPSPCGAAPAR
ncbi:MAG: efflux RND transporter periplasmic adaptor subunit [Burkholderiales bacterium]|nr:efflux RND transporter periplasmic adaptor subunit [Burkholderiales bacterium]MBS0401274.1 efflux RND transporter periplasmic adaptor subunit [Pseudomonadota bacterium]MBS0412942.1 efflux RND transporter periplasmic adaptor subunit [Pseudomonadota bacterium]